MKKLIDFININVNKKVEVNDPTNYAQCFDLVIAWCDYLGIPRVFPHLHAYQIYTIWEGAKTQYFDRIVNTPDAVPREGDIPVWGNGYGPSGHTAVALGGGNTNAFNAFSQNDPVNSASIIRTYNYNNVLGWLRPKNYSSQQPSTPTVTPRAQKDFDTWYRFVDETLKSDYYKDEGEGMKRFIADFQSKDQSIQALQGEIGKLKKHHEDVISTLDNKVLLLEEQLKVCEARPVREVEKIVEIPRQYKNSFAIKFLEVADIFEANDKT